MKDYVTVQVKVPTAQHRAFKAKCVMEGVEVKAALLEAVILWTASRKTAEDKLSTLMEDYAEDDIKQMGWKFQDAWDYVQEIKQ